LPEPFLKWAGGKRWLAKKYGHLFPKRFRRYIEPFAGSAAVFFCLQPSLAVLADRNSDLINSYEAIKGHPGEVAILLRQFQALHSPDFYYWARSVVPDDPIERAARFIYLNRTCWNGLYRVNRQGEFNVPMGTKTLVEFSNAYLQTISTALSQTTLKVSDFEAIIDMAERRDLIYIDPPYTVTHNNNNFIKYNSNLFLWEDQVRLASAIRRAVAKGALVVLSNADHAAVKELYRGFGNHYSIERTSILSGKSEHRRKTTELLITSCKPRSASPRSSTAPSNEKSQARKV
jgi:DNA adenine methylase